MARDPLRALGRADRPGARRGAPGACQDRAARSSGWLPVADEIGTAEWLRVPDANAAERQIARFAEGSGLAEIYGDLVVRPSRVA